MYRLIAALFAVLMVFTACGDSGGGGGSDDPADASNCDQLVDAGIVMLQDVLDELGKLDLADIESLGDEPPEALNDLEARGQALETRAAELGCSDDELAAGLVDKVDRLEADGPFAELILQGIKEDPSFFD